MLFFRDNGVDVVLGYDVEDLRYYLLISWISLDKLLEERLGEPNEDLDIEPALLEDFTEFAPDVFLLGDSWVFVDIGEEEESVVGVVFGTGFLERPLENCVYEFRFVYELGNGELSCFVKILHYFSQTGRLSFWP